MEAEVGTEVPNRAARAATLSASEGGKPNRSARFCFASARSSDLGSIATGFGVGIGVAVAVDAAAAATATSEDFVSFTELEGVEEAGVLVCLDTELVVVVAAADAAAGFVAAANKKYIYLFLIIRYLFNIKYFCIALFKPVSPKGKLNSSSSKAV